MNKPSKSKAEYRSRNSHSTAIVTIIDETPKTFVVRYDDGSTLRVHKDHFERDWEINPVQDAEPFDGVSAGHAITEGRTAGSNPATGADIISRMEENQARFGSFPSLLVSAETERRLQLNDRETRTFDVEEWQRRSEEQGAE